MLRTIEGIFRHDHIELAETPDVRDETRVLVTFLDQGPVELAAHGIGPARAAEPRAHLAPFAGDWEHPDMDSYDDDDATRARNAPR